MASKPILYSYYRSSCAWRVRIALEVKKIPYDYKGINLLKKEQISDDYKKVNPMGQVPALDINGKILTQSTSILEYLEEAYPQVPLLPNDIYLKSKVREIVGTIASGIQPLQNLTVLLKIGDGKEKWAHDFINKGFIALEMILKETAGKYCVGDQVTLADCCLVPQVYNAIRFKVDMNQFPNIYRINENLSELETIQKAHYSQMPDCPEEMRA